MLIDIECIGIEVISDPFAEFGVAFVFGILDRCEELGVSRGAADVFWRTASGGLDQAQIGNARYGVEKALDLDRPRLRWLALPRPPGGHQAASGWNLTLGALV